MTGSAPHEGGTGSPTGGGTHAFGLQVPETTVTIDEQHPRAVLQVDVTNALGRRVRAGAEVKPDPPLDVGWVEIAPSTFDLDLNELQKLQVTVAPPAARPAGQHSFSLRVFDVDRPADAFALSPPVTVIVAGKRKRTVPWWVYALAGVVLLAVVVGIWFVTRDDDLEVEIEDPAGDAQPFTDDGSAVSADIVEAEVRLDETEMVVDVDFAPQSVTAPDRISLIVLLDLDLDLSTPADECLEDEEKAGFEVQIASDPSGTLTGVPGSAVVLRIPDDCQGDEDWQFETTTADVTFEGDSARMVVSGLSLGQHDAVDLRVWVAPLDAEGDLRDFLVDLAPDLNRRPARAG